MDAHTISKELNARRSVVDRFVNRFYGMKTENSCESGNAIIEFILLFVLLIFPLFSYFSLVTVQSNVQMRDEEIFREVTQIIKSGENLAYSVSIANRYLILQGSSLRLQASCLVGTCPNRGSRTRVSLHNQIRSLETIIEGNNWG